MKNFPLSSLDKGAFNNPFPVRFKRSRYVNRLLDAWENPVIKDDYLAEFIIQKIKYENLTPNQKAYDLIMNNKKKFMYV